VSWEQRYVEQDTPWDKGAPAPPLLDLLESHPAYFGDGQILVPGCGRGHDARAIAKGIPKASVIGLDIAPTALQEAKTMDVHGACQFVEVDFLTSSVEDFSNVSAIFEHTCFCAIDPSLREEYAQACARLLPSGGYWIAIIFLTPREEDDPTIGPPFQASVEEIHTLFEENFTLIHSAQPINWYKGRAGKELVMIWEKK